MKKNSRFPLPNSPPPQAENLRMNYNSRFSDGRRNPFYTTNTSKPDLPINSRAAALVSDKDDEVRENPFQNRRDRNNDSNYRNSRFAFTGERDSGSFRHNTRGGGRFQRNGHRSSFIRHDAPPKRPVFSMKDNEFPPLITTSKPVDATNNSTGLDFNEAAKRGERCPTPPPREPLPPPERLDRPVKRDSGDESTGWNTEDEMEAREIDPSDDEDESIDM
jgi:hypothetical protein